MSQRWRRALVTGASSGIGWSFALALAERGTNLVLVARNQAKLDELAEKCRTEYGVEVEVLPSDLADRLALFVVAERIASNERPVDLLVNNAGLGYEGEVVSLDADKETNVVDVNVVAFHRLAKSAAEAMSSRGGGGIINVASVVAFAPFAQTATYAASKAFVLSFSRALEIELKGTGVMVSALCPGLTRTDFHQRANYDVGGTPSFFFQTPDEVAAIGLEGLERGRGVVVPGVLNRATSVALRFTPLSVLTALAPRLKDPGSLFRR